MKRLLLIAVTVLFCISLVACNADPVLPQSSISGSTGSAGFTEVPKPETLPASGWITKQDQALNDAIAFMDSGIFYMYNMCLYYMDSATGYSVSLCSKPGCSHGESESMGMLQSCDAYVPGLVTMMFYHDGSLYYTTYEEYGYELYARSQDGSGLRKVATLGSQYISKDTSVQGGSWMFAYGELYYVVQVERCITLDDNSVTYDNLMYVLLKFDLTSGEEEELLRSEDELIDLQVAHDGMAVVYTVHLPTQEEREREDYAEYIKQFPAYLRLWHEESGGVSTLCEMDMSAANSLLGFANGKIHMFGGTNTPIYAYDFATQTFGESDLPEEVSRIWSEKYGGVKWRGYYDLETGAYYTNEYDTMQLPAGIDGFGASPQAFGEQGFVVKEFYTKDHIVVASNIVFFPFEKMDDGMQLEDRIIFIRETEENGSELVQPED